MPVVLEGARMTIFLHPITGIKINIQSTTTQTIEITAVIIMKDQGAVRRKTITTFPTQPDDLKEDDLLLQSRKRKREDTNEEEEDRKRFRNYNDLNNRSKQIRSSTEQFNDKHLSSRFESSNDSGYSNKDSNSSHTSNKVLNTNEMQLIIQNAVSSAFVENSQATENKLTEENKRLQRESELIREQVNSSKEELNRWKEKYVTLRLNQDKLSSDYKKIKRRKKKPFTNEILNSSRSCNKSIPKEKLKCKRPNRSKGSFNSPSKI